EVRDNKGVVVIEVSDSGPGMEPERLAKLADPIQRLELKERGLGLGIVYQVCRVCGGRMEAESKVGVGTRVKLVLPPPEG
ncbi:MAG TPA: HAMP domain-containing sensor histidine kinase, partial [Tepidisphaeraceae bacterium]|nr:HAMP domain-containing sensor histidine kinase [Tepidisphaeraceae bacterium]